MKDEHILLIVSFTLFLIGIPFLIITFLLQNPFWSFITGFIAILALADAIIILFGELFTLLINLTKRPKKDINKNKS